MKHIGKKFGISKYHKKMYLMIAGTFLAVFIIYALAIRQNVRSNILSYYKQNVQQSAVQLDNSISYISENIRLITKSIYYSPDVANMMYAKVIEDDVFFWNQKISAIKTSYINPNPAIHSVSIFNYNAQSYFSTYNGLYYHDILLENALKDYEVVPILQPVTRQIKNPYKGKGKPETDVLTYAMYDSMDKNKRPMGAVYVNISLDYIMSSIKSACMLNPDIDTRMFILTEKQELISGNGSDPDYIALTAYPEHKQQPDQLSNVKIVELNGKKQLLTFIAVKDTKWGVYLLQPYDQVFKSLRKIETLIAILTAAFILITGVMILPITKQLYRPIRNLAGKVAQSNGPLRKETGSDDFALLNKVYTNLIEENSLLRLRGSRAEVITQNYHLKNLLCDSHNVQPLQLEVLRERIDGFTSIHGQFVVCCVQIRHYFGVGRQHPYMENQLYYTALANISSELIGRSYPNTAIEYQESHVAVIISLPEGSRADFLQPLQAAADEININMRRYFAVDACVSCSREGTGLPALTGLYNTALQNLNYLSVFPKHTLIYEALVEKNSANARAKYSLELDNKLAAAVKQANQDDVEKVLDAIFDEIKTLNRTGINASILHLIMLVTQVLSETDSSRAIPSNINYKKAADSMLAIDSCDMLQLEIKELIFSMFDTNNSLLQEKHQLIIATVNSIISNTFDDSSLSLQSLADQIGMSSAYIGKLFKNLTGSSVSEAINNARMQRAKELLLNSNNGVSSIMKKVGIENESQFYKLFKKSFGMTPKEYMIHCRSSLKN